MSIAPLRVGQAARAPTPVRSGSEIAWGLLAPAGLTFALVALVDLALVWVPVRLGDTGWQFDTVSAVLDGMPMLAMGLVLGYGAALARSRYVTLRWWSAAMVLVAIALLMAFGLYLFSVPAVLASAGSAETRLGLTKAVIQTGAQGIAYPTALFWLGTRGWRHAS